MPRDGHQDVSSMATVQVDDFQAKESQNTWQNTVQLPPAPKRLPAALLVCGISLVGVTGNVGNMVTEIISGELIAMGLPKSLGRSQRNVR